MPRSNQTKQLLAQSLQELMATTPLEKISVNDIVDHANVGRNTFYYHFEDKYDLVNWYFQSGITRFLVELSAYSSWNALLAALETYFLENKVFYCNALAYNGQNSLQQYMFDYLRSIFEQNVRELSPDASAEDTRKIGQFFAGAMMGILIPWVLSGMKSNALSNMSELSIPVFNHEVMQDDWLESMAQETLCCMCARKPGTSDETARKLRRSIVSGRLETGKPVLLLDWDGDVRYLNNRISEYMTFGSVLPEGSTFPLQLG